MHRTLTLIISCLWITSTTCYKDDDDLTFKTVITVAPIAAILKQEKRHPQEYLKPPFETEGTYTPTKKYK